MSLRFCKFCFEVTFDEKPKVSGAPGVCDHCEQHKVCFAAEEGDE